MEQDFVAKLRIELISGSEEERAGRGIFIPLVEVDEKSLLEPLTVPLRRSLHQRAYRLGHAP